MTIYLDDIRENPRNTILAQSVNECKKYIQKLEQAKVDIIHNSIKIY